MKNYFITGTDTDVGKTHVAVTLLEHCNELNLKTFGIKPIASGCSQDHEGNWINADALALQKHSSIQRPYSTVNPFAFKEPIAPHLAAKNAGIQLTVASVVDRLSQSIQPQADINIIEGVGGWLVPLNDQELVADVVRVLQIPTILVVGIKLGCINHAILTSKSIMQMQVPFVGWIANCIEPKTEAMSDIIGTLKQWLTVPLLGVFPRGVRPDVAVKSELIKLLVSRNEVSN